MSAERSHGSPAYPIARPQEPAIRGFAALFGVHDVLLLLYFGVLGVLLGLSGPSASSAEGTRRVYVCIAILVLGCLVGRGPNDLPPQLRSVTYRATVVFVIVEGYLMLKVLLPVLRCDALDERLLAFDLEHFGVEPAFWLERFATPAIVEYFAFFYFSYFGLCVLFMMLVIGRPPFGLETSRFAIGTVIVCCLGQLGYIAVPAYGPAHAMVDQFDAPLVGGFWWDCVQRTVAAGSALKDVFPSLHTAQPLWFALYAFDRGRTNERWRWIAWITAIFSAHIIVSTMLLRWHYLIDVVAGVCLAFFASWASRRLANWEGRVRAALKAPPAWMF